MNSKSRHVAEKHALLESRMQLPGVLGQACRRGCGGALTEEGRHRRHFVPPASASRLSTGTGAFRGTHRQRRGCSFFRAASEAVWVGPSSQFVALFSSILGRLLRHSLCGEAKRSHRHFHIFMITFMIRRFCANKLTTWAIAAVVLDSYSSPLFFWKLQETAVLGMWNM